MNFVSKLKLQYYTTKLKLEMQKKINSALPLGSIIPFAGSKAPDTYLFCDGSEVSRTEYADLFNIVGTMYGEGDGSTTFNLPNMKGRIPVGSNPSDNDFKTLGKMIGEKTHTLTTDEMPAHNHTFDYNNWDLGYTSGSNPVTYTNIAGNLNIKSTKNTGGSQAHNNIQPSLIVNYIIKAKYDTQTVQDLNIYSLDEHRIGTWVNGKPLYRKTVDTGSIPNGTGKFIPHGISNIQTVTSLHGIAFDPIGRSRVNLPYTEIEASHAIPLFIDDTRIVINTISNMSKYTESFITVEYTKTTD